jgi:hypothetical protein
MKPIERKKREKGRREEQKKRAKTPPRQLRRKIALIAFKGS